MGNFQPHDSYKKNSYKKEMVYLLNDKEKIISVLCIKTFLKNEMEQDIKIPDLNQIKPYFYQTKTLYILYNTEYSMFVSIL